MDNAPADNTSEFNFMRFVSETRINSDTHYFTQMFQNFN